MSLLVIGRSMTVTIHVKCSVLKLVGPEEMLSSGLYSSLSFGGPVKTLAVNYWICEVIMRNANPVVRGRCIETITQHGSCFSFPGLILIFIFFLFFFIPFNFHLREYIFI